MGGGIGKLGVEDDDDDVEEDDVVDDDVDFFK